MSEWQSRISNLQWRLLGTVVAFWLFGFIEMAVVKSYGVLIDQIVFQLRSDLGTIGMIVGVFHGISFFLGPLVDVAFKYLTVSGIAAIGLIGGASLCASAFVTTVWQMAATMTLSGSAYAFVILAAIVRFKECVPSDKFALLFSICHAGNAVGMIVGPIVAEFLTETYGWRGTVLMLGGMYLNVPLLLFMMTSSVGQRDVTVMRKGQESDEEDMIDGPMYSDAIPLLEQSPERPLPSSKGEAEMDAGVPDGSFGTSERSPLVKDQSLHSASYNDDITPLVDESTSEHGASDDESCHGNSNNDKQSFKKRALVVLRNSFVASSITKEPYFLLFYCYSVVSGLVLTAWVVFLIPHGVSKGYPLSRSVFLASFGGVGSILGRLHTGPVLHTKRLSAVDLTILMHFINAVVFLLDPLVASFWLLSFNAFLGGFTIGGKLTSSSIVIKESYPAKAYSSAVALYGCAFSLGQPFGGFVTGWLAISMDYSKAFMVLGSVEMVGCVLLIPFRYFYNRRQIKEES